MLHLTLQTHERQQVFMNDHSYSKHQHGDFLIITMEGDDPAASWAQICLQCLLNLLNLPPRFMD